MKSRQRCSLVNVLTLSAGLLAILTTGCATPDVRKSYPPEWSGERGIESPEWSDNRAPELESLIRQHCAPFIAEAKSVGLAVGVISATNTTVMAFGRSSADSGKAAQGDTLYEIGSITKTFTGIALAREIERGNLRLDQPVAELLPTGLELPKAARTVTLRHLTTHTSGFPRQPGNFSFWHALRKLATGGNPYADYSEEQFREALRTVELDSIPGSQFQYSNFGIDLLGYLLSQKAGMSYETYIQREICEPLGMHDTAVTLTTNQNSRFAQGYITAKRSGGRLQVILSSPWDLPNHLAGSGALRSSASDMLKYLQANMRPEGSLSNVIRQSHRELYRQSNISSVGMNWLSSPEEHPRIIWHNGGTGGASSYLGFTEDGQAGVVILSNVGMHRVDDLGRKMLIELANGSDKPNTKYGYARVAPYTSVRWEKNLPIVRVRDRWFQLVSIDGIPIDQIMEFAQREFGAKAHMRFAEDLVEVLSKMGHDPEWTVTLGLKRKDGQVEHVQVRMTEENRALVKK
jgi:CubicO group peptidase (beta-lactamase class C family)